MASTVRPFTRKLSVGSPVTITSSSNSTLAIIVWPLFKSFVISSLVNIEIVLINAALVSTLIATLSNKPACSRLASLPASLWIVLVGIPARSTAFFKEFSIIAMPLTSMSPCWITYLNLNAFPVEPFWVYIASTIWVPTIKLTVGSPLTTTASSKFTVTKTSLPAFKIFWATHRGLKPIKRGNNTKTSLIRIFLFLSCTAHLT